MNSIVLILTLAMYNGYGGQGGVATAEFDSMSACNKAGSTWVQKTNALRAAKYTGKSESFYLCVKK